MDWLKKNLILVIGGIVSLAIIGGAGWYLFSKIQTDQDVDAQLTAVRGTFNSLMEKKPFPNSDNLEAAKEQLARISQFLTNANHYFGAPITAKDMRNTEFSSLLAQTIDNLKLTAQSLKITIPTNYAFSFSAQRDLMRFDTNTMTKVVAQIEDVRMLAGVLFNARIYELIAIQRSPVTSDDTNALTLKASDYLSTKRVSTTEFATIYPYVATIRCSTPELASVLEGLAHAQYGFFVKWIRVEPGEVQNEGEDTSGGSSLAAGMAASLRARYARYGPSRSEASAPTPDSAAIAAKKPGVILKEKPLKVMIMIDVIKGLASTRNP